MLSMKQLAAMAGENIQPVAWEVWLVVLPDEKEFEVSGEIAARDWVRKYGGTCYFTGKLEAPSIT